MIFGCLLINSLVRDKGAPSPLYLPQIPNTSSFGPAFVICIKGCKETAEVYFVRLYFIYRLYMQFWEFCLGSEATISASLLYVRDITEPTDSIICCPGPCFVAEAL